MWPATARARRCIARANPMRFPLAICSWRATRRTSAVRYCTRMAERSSGARNIVNGAALVPDTTIGTRPCLMNRDGGAERLIWRQIPRLISCTMTCAGGTSAKHPLTRCHLTTSEKAKSRPAADSRRERMAATRSTRSTTRIRRTRPRAIMSGRLTGSMRRSATDHADAALQALLCRSRDALFRLWLQHGSFGNETPLPRRPGGESGRA